MSNEYLGYLFKFGLNVYRKNAAIDRKRVWPKSGTNMIISHEYSELSLNQIFVKNFTNILYDCKNEACIFTCNTIVETSPKCDMVTYDIQIVNGVIGNSKQVEGVNILLGYFFLVSIFIC